jgi:hypothetical protein
MSFRLQAIEESAFGTVYRGEHAVGDATGRALFFRLNETFARGSPLGRYVKDALPRLQRCAAPHIIYQVPVAEPDGADDKGRLYCLINASQDAVPLEIVILSLARESQAQLMARWILSGALAAAEELGDLRKHHDESLLHPAINHRTMLVTSQGELLLKSIPVIPAWPQDLLMRRVVTPIPREVIDLTKSSGPRLAENVRAIAAELSSRKLLPPALEAFFSEGASGVSSGLPEMRAIVGKPEKPTDIAGVVQRLIGDIDDDDLTPVPSATWAKFPCHAKTMAGDQRYRSWATARSREAS